MPSRDQCADRFQVGGYYLDCPHPERGGVWYACWYDAARRTTRRRSLGTTDQEEAKTRLFALILAAPQAKSAGAPDPSQVLTLSVLDAYIDRRGAAIASEEQADRAIELFTDYLTSTERPDAPVAFWTPSQQVACARWLHETFDHSAGYIERLFTVLRAAFIDATKVRMRQGADGVETETALMSSAPHIGMKRHEVAAELEIPPWRPRRKTLSFDEMARVLGAIETPHLFRYAIMALCTWARPQAIIDFDPTTQVDWNIPAIDLAPPDWRPTKKRRPQQPMTQCLADWLIAWAQEDATQRADDIRRGRDPCPSALLVYKRKRVASTKKAWQRLGQELGLDGFTQRSFRYFMADQVKTLFRRVHREQRSRWLGHVVRDGSRTTDHYESDDDPLALADVALATDCVLALLAEKCERQLFAIDVRLNRDQLVAIGARAMPKNVVKSRVNGGRDRDRTCDPYHVKVVLFR
jgi:hypothetical protein